MYKVFIPTAGLGSRLGGLAKNINKSLISIAHKPAISHIIEKFSEETEFVIATGYKAETVVEFLEMAYPNRKFNFVCVENYAGEGSGLGHTMLCCKEHLQVPFIFCSNDTVVTDDIPKPDCNWMGYDEREDNSQYRSLRIANGGVQEICAKGADGEVKPYIGLAGIHDYKLFWQAMEQGADGGAIGIGESYGLRHLIASGIQSRKFSWFDTGNKDSLAQTRQHFNYANEANILEKEDEAIWFVNGKVIKFSTDKTFITQRVERARFLEGFVPNIVAKSENMYAYTKVEGTVFSAAPSLQNFKYFLSWIENFWEEFSLSKESKDNFSQRCDEFYRNKTYARVKEFFSRFEQIDAEEIINGETIPKIDEVLAKVPWNELAEGTPVRFHGDLHFENILINNHAKTPFTLLDWRQNFGGDKQIGDIYYDLAKLNHGIIISHEIIEQDLFDVERKLNVINFDFLRKQSSMQLETHFKEWIDSSGFSNYKVQLLTALIYLNIAALHHYPYSLLLFYLGKSMLWNLVRPDSTIQN